MTKPDMMLWFSDARGIFIPRDFANCFIDGFTRDKHVTGVSAEDWAILEAGPDDESYWDVWAHVLDNAKMTDENGAEFTLHQDGDLWLIPIGMEWDDEAGTFNWPQERDIAYTEQDDDCP
jgi:hypothetical protein